MRLTLFNFKSWKDKTFELGEEGVFLISGKSGVGKTTILEAILFVLYGIGTKVTSHGASSCKVTLELNNHKIIRTKRPNRVIYDTIHEDDDAQAIINKEFGDNFFMTNYIKQNSYNSFILLSPLEKLSFLEKFALGDHTLNSIKDKLKRLIRERSDNLISIESQIEVIQKLISDKVLPKEVFNPVKNLSIENYEKVVTKYQKNLDVKDSRYKKLRKGIDFLKEKLSAILVLNKSRELIEIELNEITQKIKGLECKDRVINIDNLSLELKNYKSILSKILKNKDLVFAEKKLKIDEEKYENSYNTSKDNLDKKIDKIKRKLWVNMTHMECVEQIQDYKNLIIDLENLEKYKGRLSKINLDDIDYESQISNLDEKIREMKHNLEIAKQIYHCPSCKTRLVMGESKLLLSTENVNISVNYKKEIRNCTETRNGLLLKLDENNIRKQKYNTLQSNIEEIEEKYEELFEINEIKSDLIESEEFLRENLEKERELKSIIEKRENLFVELREDILEQKNNIKKLRKTVEDFDNNIDEETIREKINFNENIINSYTENQITLNNLRDKEKVYNDKLSTEKVKFLEKFKTIPPGGISDLQESIKKYEIEFESLEERCTELRENLGQIDKYIRFLKEMGEFEGWKINLTDLQEKEIFSRQKLTSATTLREKIQEAESLTIYNIIQTINNHLQSYLEIFFEENPMVIMLQSFKEDKKQNKKPQINLAIDYKGMECDINMLSGGELQRVIIAFTLSLAEMSQSPLLLLDECTSNLDQDLTNTVIGGIKKHFSQKNVLIIAHQVVSGIFDNVIKI